MAEQLDPSIITRGMRPIAPVDPIQIMQQVGDLNAQRQMADYRQQQIELSQANEDTRRQALATAKKKADEDAEVEKLRQSGIELNKDGIYVFNPTILDTYAREKGLTHRLPAVLEELNKTNDIAAKSKKSIEEAKQYGAETLAGWARSAIALDGGTLDSFSNAARIALLNKTITKEQLAPYVEYVNSHPQDVPQLLQSIIQQSTKGAEVGVQQQNAATSQQNAETTAARLTTETPGIQARAALTEAELAGTVPMSLAQRATDARMRDQNALQAAERADKVKTAKQVAADNAEQIVNGNIPVSLLSRRGAEYNETLAEANRLNKERTGKPINIGQLQIDYEGAKRFASTINGSQMTRYRGLADAVVNTIDEVNRLSDELKQGGVQKWNDVKRSTIQKVYGNTPQSELAAQYVGAVNTLKEEFANLANGGFAPTDAAWKLANAQINEDFGFKDMRASLSEVQRLVNFRTHAMTSLRPISTTGETTTQTPSSERVRVIGPSGETGTMPASSTLPPGWRKQ